MTDAAWIGATLTAARPQALSALVRYFRDLDLAEEAFQDASPRALKAWPKNGPPRNAAGPIVVSRSLPLTGGVANALQQGHSVGVHRAPARIVELRRQASTAGWHCGHDRPLVMGIVNVTPDSFSDGGTYLDPSAAIVGTIRAGLFPRDMALEPAGTVLLVSNFGSGTLEPVHVVDHAQESDH